jgi:phage shock protein A
MASSIFGRVSQLVKANINSMIDDAEDPEKMIDQLIRDFTSNMAEAEKAVAETVGNLRLLEEDNKEAVDAAAEWGNKAKAASLKADELRTAGKETEANQYDELAKVALRRQLSFEEQVKTYATQIAQQTEVTDKLKDGLQKMRERRDELVQKRSELVARSKMAKAQQKVQTAVKNVNVMDPTSDLNRFEEKIRSEEAMARGMEEVSMNTVEDQFAALEADTDEMEIEARLKLLKAG